MRSYLPFLVIGLTAGSVYALAAMGLVVTYTTSGVFNFAHGAVGMMATYAFYSLRVDAGVPTPVAIALAVLIVAPLFGVFFDRVLLRRLAGASPAAYVVSSLGLLVALQGLAIAIYGGLPRQVAPFFPTSTFNVPGVNVGYDQLLVVLIAAATAAGLALFFRRTHLGLRMRAVVTDPELTELVGTEAQRVTTFSWMLGSASAALAGILLAPFIGIDGVVLTLLVIQAFGAAAVGRFTSLPGAYLGAILIGVVASLSTKLAAGRPGLAGIPTSIPFILLFAVLVVSKKGSFSEVVTERRPAGGRATTRAGSRPAGRRFPLLPLAAFTAVAALMPSVFEGARLVTATTGLVFVLIFASLGLLVGTARLVSLSHVVFVAFGATTLSHLLSAGAPYPVALFLAAALVVPVGAIVAIPAIRLSGLFLALATLGFTILAQDLLFPTGIGFGRDSVVHIPRVSWLSSDVRFYYFVLAISVAGVLAIELVRVTRLGRLLRGLADSPTAVQSLGVQPTVSRVLVFCLSAFLAALAGGLLGSITQAASPVTFGFFESLVWITVLVTAGCSSMGGAVLAAVLFIGVPAAFGSSTLDEYRPILFGVAAILLAQSSNGLAGLLRLPDFAGLAERHRWRLERSPVRSRWIAARGES